MLIFKAIRHRFVKDSRCRRPLAALAVAAIVVAMAPAPGWSQSAMPAGSPGRFTMHPTDGGVLRLDTQTGTLSMCRQTTGAWSCSMLPDDRAAASDEIARLKSENEELRTAVKRLEEMANLPPPPPGALGTEAPRHQPGIQLPTEEDVDKAMDYLTRMLKKFKDKIKQLEDPDGKRGTNL